METIQWATVILELLTAIINFATATVELGTALLGFVTGCLLMIYAGLKLRDYCQRHRNKR